jgi:CubicO group peptidase (beta-lactamase class C family)
MTRIHILFLTVVVSTLLMLPTAYVVGQQSSDTLADTIHTYLEQLPSDYFSGAVLIAQDDEVLLPSAYGMADENTPFTSETVVDAGSIAKQFTAVALLHLQSRGLLHVRDTLKTFFADVPDDKVGITLEQLLTHSSGLTEHSDGDLVPLSKDEALARIFALDLGFVPGSRYEYSNAGYTLLAIIIEQVSGQSFTEYLHEHLFRPAGLISTGFYAEAQWTSRVVANGYFNGEDQGSPALWSGPYWGLLGNGGILTTIDDLYRWWQALRSGEVIPPDAAQELFVPRILQEEGSAVYYGYGWTIDQTDYGQRIGHNGGGIGGNSIITTYVDEGLTIIILSNRIIYREMLGIPCHVELPADEISQQLAINILTNDFASLPKKTLTVCGG